MMLRPEFLLCGRPLICAIHPVLSRKKPQHYSIEVREVQTRSLVYYSPGGTIEEAIALGESITRCFADCTFVGKFTEGERRAQPS